MYIVSWICRAQKGDGNWYGDQVLGALLEFVGTGGFKVSNKWYCTEYSLAFVYRKFKLSFKAYKYWFCNFTHVILQHTLSNICGSWILSKTLTMFVCHKHERSTFVQRHICSRLHFFKDHSWMFTWRECHNTDLIHAWAWYTVDENVGLQFV